MAEEVEEVCGPKGRHDPDRVAYRHGSDDGEVTLGGRRVAVARPRMRTRDGVEEVPVCTYEHFASRDQLTAVVLERMLAASPPVATAGCRSRSAARSRPRRGRRRSRRSRARSSRGPRRR